MPRSSVFVRLNWPSRSDDSSFESEGSPQIHGVVPSSTSHGHLEKTSSSSSGDSFERKLLDKEGSIFTACIPSAGNMEGERYTPDVQSSSSTSVQKSVIPTVQRETKALYKAGGVLAPASHTAAVPPIDRNACLVSPYWFTGQYGEETCQTQTTECPQQLDTNKFATVRRSGSRSLKASKPKTKPKPRHFTNKGKKITRSLSASCVSVSTNTDPRDFVELAKVSATLPIRRRPKVPQTSCFRSTENKAVSCSLDQEETHQQEGNSLLESGYENRIPVSEEIFFKKIVQPCAQTPCSIFYPDYSQKESDQYEYDFPIAGAYSLPCTPTVPEKPFINCESCSSNRDDESIRGYIELPTYVPSNDHPCNVSASRNSHFAGQVISVEHPILALTSSKFEELALEDAPYIDDEAFTALTSKREPVKPRSCTEPSENESSLKNLLDSGANKALDTNNSSLDQGFQEPEMLQEKVEIEDVEKTVKYQEHDSKNMTSHSDMPDRDKIIDRNIREQEKSKEDPPFEKEKLLENCELNSKNPDTPVSSPVLVVHQHDLAQDRLDVLPLLQQLQRCPDVQYVVEDCDQSSEEIRKNFYGEDEEGCPPIQWSPMPKRHLLLQAAARRHLEKDISIESCPDVVLQTLEGDGSSLPKSHKKTVTFLLPPEHWDSLISLRENNLGGYPRSGYAELDSALLPPNGQDPYRNTPSPGLHGVPQDRYDPGLEGDYPDDGRYSGNDPGIGCPPDSVVYGRLLGTPRSPYTLNGGVVGSSAEPLLPSPGLYDEEPHSASHPAPPPHMSLPTPSLPPPPVQNDDNYVHPNLLRSPSADSGAPRVQWRDPDLHEVIDFLSNPNNVVKANAAAYLQHLCYMDDPTKEKTRILGGIPPLVALLSHDLPELHRNACGALRNLSYGRQNDENKRAIRDASGIPSLVRLLRKTPDNEIKELVTGILWNLSSCEDLKHSIIDDALTVTVSHVIIPCSGWDDGEVERDPNIDVWWSTVFKNASGVLRNVSSAGEYARTKLRQCNGLVDSLLTVIKSAIAGASHDNKSVENCVCILRNLSYRCQEVEDPNYDKNQPPTQSRATATTKGDNLGCFGGSRKKKEAVGGALKETSSGQRSTGPRTEPLRGMELLWQPEVVVGPYLALLSDCSNPETLEAAAGALQNLAACYWQPSIDVRASVRKEKGLPILVELLRMEVDRVVCAVATALRNLAIDQRNKELIGKYAMRELVQKLPSGNTHDTGTSDETIAAVLATLNEVIKKNAEFSRSLLDFGGVEKLVSMTKLRGRYSVRVVKFASQVLFSMWGHQELREVYKKHNFKEQDFVSKSVAARNASGGGANSPTANNTLNRPMASQGGTRYEDKTIQRGQGKAHQQA
ncbi:Plakophilin-4 [Halocaridina rubra]|uniref:Plakophilin-4 n=1 Tax=Halocaridina rubra TaxID=373956 RepID=A0AAN8XSN4_HALRR